MDYLRQGRRAAGGAARLGGEAAAPSGFLPGGPGLFIIQRDLIKRLF